MEPAVLNRPSPMQMPVEDDSRGVAGERGGGLHDASGPDQTLSVGAQGEEWGGWQSGALALFLSRSPARDLPPLSLPPSLPWSALCDS